MEKTHTTPLSKKNDPLNDSLQQLRQKIEHLSAEECFEWVTKIMYYAILFLGIPYFIFVLISFIRMAA
ncbi:hypothetical protein [Sporolactobacillus inulinus]|jgi:hypothetical protein|uniref:Uncharacterized protein n=2 Tax=Sporolactobacillus inulinus TaxID=2078 RepID=A0A4Y3T028_9BACL|nr:hypothetical protein [Sporolactobacillus inulinus]KLI03834.1 hypothetical protein SINU_00810 [Sporolactobacillus inulinus CASD]GAY76058.1 hypothetical protein NBRC111894_1612 [Sporolactobacillus inulinus]GEB76081.1 hypothetical protein SIN01_04260 [Sporolactobacillus inulinus]